MPDSGVEDFEKRLEYLRLLQEKDRRLREEGIHYYKPYVTKEGKSPQKEVHQDFSRIRLVTGGNRTGKTFLAVAEACWFALGIHPFRKVRTPTIVWIASDSHAKNRDVFAPLFKRLLPKKDILKTVQSPREGLLRIHLRNGSEISFKSYEAGRESFQGAEIPFIILDEEPPEDIFAECLMRGATCDGTILIAMTAVRGITWIYHKLYIPATKDKNLSIGLHRLSTMDNPYIPDKEKEYLFQALTETDRRIRLFGEFVHRSGLVYEEWDRKVHVVKKMPLPRAVSLYEGLDPGRHTFAVVFAYTDPWDNLVVYDEIYMHNANLGNLKEAVHQKREEHRYGGDDVVGVIDQASAQKHVGMHASVRDQLMEPPFPVYAKPGNSNRDAGIFRCKEYLRFRRDEQGRAVSKPRVFVMDNCVNFIQEIENYHHKKKNTGKLSMSQEISDRVEEGQDHLMDAWRYLCMSLPPISELMDHPTSGLSFQDYQNETSRLVRRLDNAARNTAKSWRPNGL